MKQLKLLNVFILNLVILSTTGYAQVVDQPSNVDVKLTTVAYNLDQTQQREAAALALTDQKNFTASFSQNQSVTESPYWVLIPTNPDTGYRTRVSKDLEGDDTLTVTLVNGSYDAEGHHHGEIIKRSIDLQSGNIIRLQYKDDNFVLAQHTPTYTPGWMGEAKFMLDIVTNGYSRLTKVTDKVKLIRLRNELWNIIFKVIYHQF